MSRAVPKKTAAEGVAAAPDRRPGIVAHLYPAVALVGRPNVGKSSLFNALLRSDVSITDARPGTTRDRVLHPVLLAEKPCDLLDTAGIEGPEVSLQKQLRQQIEAAVAEATVLAFIVDAQDGVTPQDREIAARLHRVGCPVVLVANKSEGREAGLTVGEFAALGFGSAVATSAVHRLGLDDLEEALAAHLPAAPETVPDMDWEGLPKLAIVGRRNVGKSSFLNTLARQERTIVSDQPGTTRDSVDLLFEKDGRRFCLIDTAGLRRMKEPEGPAEFFSQVRTERAIRRADVVLLMVEAEEGVSTTDRKTADLILEASKPCLIVVNKWDLAPKGAVTGDYMQYVETRLPSLRHAPLAFTSARNGTRCWQALDVALELYDQARTQVPTPRLNKALVRAEYEHEPPACKGRKPRLLYGVQVADGPPTFVIYCRHADLIDVRYKRYLNLRLGEILGLLEIPMRIFFREAPREKRGRR